MNLKKDIARDHLEEFVPSEVRAFVQELGQKGIPQLAKNLYLTHSIEQNIHHIPTDHKLMNSDSRQMNSLKDNSIQLVVTSPPYWTLKEYPKQPCQLGTIEDYDNFLSQLDRVWQEAFRVLVPCGRLIVVVGDVCLSRRKMGRHVVYPLHSSIQERCRHIGFDNLAPIIWHKIANAQFEVENGSSFLGKPYEPNAIIKNDIEYILFQRKHGGYRNPSLSARILSVIPESSHRKWFQQIWTVGGASTRKHPAPFPLEVATRLIRMFSFVGDTVLDPFMGTGVTNVAACQWGRNSVGFEVEPSYFVMAEQNLNKAKAVQVKLNLD